MIKLILLVLFFTLLMGTTLGLDLSLAPGLSVKNAFLYALFAILGLQTAVARNRTLELTSVVIPFGLLVIYGLVSAVIVFLFFDYPGYRPLTILQSLKGGLVDRFLVFLVFFYGVLSIKDAMWLLKAILWTVIACNFIAFIDVWNIPDLGVIAVDEDGRLGGTFGEPNEYGTFLALFLPATIALCTTARKGVRILAAAGALVTGLALMMTASRGAIAGLAGSLVLGTFYLRHYIPVRTIIRGSIGLLVFSIGAISLLVLLGYGDLLYDRFIFTSGQTNIDQLSSFRTIMWRRALGKMSDFPVTFLTGFGWDVYNAWKIFRYGTHNTYMTLLFNTGVLGLVIFGAIVGAVITTCRRSLREKSQELTPHLIAFVFGFFALLGAIFFSELSTTWLFFWAYVGVIMRCALQVRNSSSEIPSILKHADSAPRNGSFGAATDPSNRLMPCDR